MSKSYILSRMDWAKAYRDYEVLRVGKENLLPYFTNSDFWTLASGWVIVSDTKIKIELNSNRIIRTNTITLKPNTDYTFTFNSDYARYYIHNESDDSYVIYDATGGSSVKSFNSGDTINNKVYLSISTWSQNLDKTRTVWELKLEEGENATPYTPNPSEINASPFTVKLAQDYYNQQQEITELRNAILQLGGQ